MRIISKALWAGFTLVSLAAPALGRLLVVSSGAIVDSEVDLFPDPREREGFRLQSLRNAAQGYAGAHDGRFPSDLQTLIRWIPAEERAAVAGWTVDLWRTPVLYEPFGPASFSVRSAGADRAWRTDDDVVVWGSQVSIERLCADSAIRAPADSLAARFDAHQFVFIGSTHGDLKIEQFLGCLITRPTFTRRVTDIVVEWAGSGQQRLIDRYILALEPIPEDSLAPIWLDTDAPTLWTTLPQVRQTMRTLRDVNSTLPAAKRIRLLGGNDGVDWTKVRVAEDLAPYPFKTNFLPHLLVEHLAKMPDRRTLVVYGDCHIHYGASTFMGDVIASLGRRQLFVTGRIGELAPAERDFLAATGDPTQPFFAVAERFPKNVRLPASLRVCGEEASRAPDYIDGFVYLGPTPDRSLIDSIPLTADQRRELARRASIMSDPQRTMRARYQGRARWFRDHPNDVPPPPVIREGTPR
jgi:hypothetical protein